MSAGVNASSRTTRHATPRHVPPPPSLDRSEAHLPVSPTAQGRGHRADDASPPLLPHGCCATTEGGGRASTVGRDRRGHLTVCQRKKCRAALRPSRRLSSSLPSSPTTSKIDLIRAFWKEREEQQAGSVRPDAIHACISADCDRAGYRPTTLDSDDHPRREIACPSCSRRRLQRALRRA